MENVEFEHSMPHRMVDYIPDSVVIKSIMRKKTGTVTITSFDTGEILAAKIPFRQPCTVN